MKRFTETSRRRYTGMQPGTKSASRPADKPRINRWSTASFVPPSVYIGFSLFVLPKSRPQRSSLIRQSVRGTVLSWANRSVGVPFCPALPSPPLRRARSPAPTRPWYVRVLDSTSGYLQIANCDHSPTDGQQASLFVSSSQTLTAAELRIKQLPVFAARQKSLTAAEPWDICFVFLNE